jgi:FemAB-related protein (PEP-CTERM system-associated)
VVAANASQSEWDRYVEGHPMATSEHLWNWRGIFEDVFGQRSVYLTARRGPVTVGILPLVLFRSRLFGRFVVSLPFCNYGGMLASDEEVPSALLRHATDIAIDFGASHIELRHQQRLLPEMPSRQHKLALRLPLSGTVDDVWQALDRKVRNQVRKARKEGLRVVCGSGELVEEFYPVFARNMRDHGTPVYPKRLFSETLKRFPERARVYVVRTPRRAIAGAIAVTFRDTVLVPWASSLHEYRHLCSNMLLYWTMLERATIGNARTFDFGRSSPGSGAHHFKLQWGAREQPLCFEYVLRARHDVPDQGPENARFRAAIDAWKRLPLWIANGVGPRIVRHIP